MGFNQLDGKDPSVYLDKVKKQAKRLFQISKTTNNNLAIDNLSQAQQILAKINGFPDWHSLAKSVENDHNSSELENDSKIYNLADNSLITNNQLNDYVNMNGNFIENNGVYYLETEKNYRSFLSFPYSNKALSAVEFQAILNAVLEDVEFFLITGEHELNFNYALVKENQSKDMYSLMNVAKELNLGIYDMENMFLVEMKNKGLKIMKGYFTLEFITIKNYDFSLDEHVALSKKLEDFLSKQTDLPDNVFFIKSLVDCNILINNSSEIKKNFLFESLLSQTDKMNAMFAFIEILKERNLDFKIAFGSSEMIQIATREDNYFRLCQLTDALLKTQNFSKKTIILSNYCETSNLVNIKNEIGINFEKYGDNQILNFDVSKNVSNELNVTFLYSDNIVRLRKLTSCLALEKYFTNPKTEVKTLMLGADFSNSVYLKSLDNLGFVDNIKFNRDVLPNPLMLPIGVNVFSEELSMSVAKIIYSLLEINDMNLRDSISVLSACIEALNRLSPVMYQSGNVNIDNAVKKIDIDLTIPISYHDLSLKLWNSKLYSEAKEAKISGCHSLKDLIYILQTPIIESRFGSIRISNNQKFLEWLANKLVDIIKNNKISSMYLDFDEKKKVFNLNISKGDANRMDNYIQDYISYFFTTFFDYNGIKEKKVLVIDETERTFFLNHLIDRLNENNLAIIMATKKIKYFSGVINEYPNCFSQVPLSAFTYSSFLKDKAEDVWFYKTSENKTGELIYFK